MYKDRNQNCKRVFKLSAKYVCEKYGQICCHSCRNFTAKNVRPVPRGIARRIDKVFKRAKNGNNRNLVERNNVVKPNKIRKQSPRPPRGRRRNPRNRIKRPLPKRKPKQKGKQKIPKGKKTKKQKKQNNKRNMAKRRIPGRNRRARMFRRRNG